jgi:DNA gyrase inhibitor GyrI
MSADATPWVISVKDLPVLHVASISCKVDVEPSLLDGEIRACFRRVQAWVEGLGYDPLAWPSIGAFTTAEGRLTAYACCIRVPETVQRGSEGIEVRDLVGGKYAVLEVAKAPVTIGETVSRFYQSYVPEHNLTLDGTRPTYEVYYKTTMEYCAPVL